MKMMLAAFAVICLISATTSVPVYGTARYGRPPWAYRAAPTYYRQPYPFAQTYPEDIYYQPDPIMHYSYYPISRPYSKNEVYQTLYPYYYSRPYSYYTSEDSYVPTDDITDGLHEDALRNNGRTDALPVGQETWFEGESVPRWQNDYDDVNAAFLQNLIATQVYNDALAKNQQSEPGKPQEKQQEVEEYDDHRAPEYYGDRDTRDFEDEDVRELKALAGKPLYHVPKTNTFSLSNNDQVYRNQQWRHEYSTPSAVRREDDHYNDDYPSDEAWINWGSKRGEKSQKQINQKLKFAIKTTLAPPTATMISSTKIPATVTIGGQKEEVLLRPATPVRHPFPEPVMQMLAANSAQKKRAPSVYDTIKQLLSMEESFKPNPENKPRMQKRFVATEDDLVGELRGLKRRSPA